MIWCVEDDASIRDIELYALNSAGFATKGFDDGLAFWEALKKEQPQLVLLDVMLPGMDGIELLTKMKQELAYKQIPVILATAKGQEYDRIHGLRKEAQEKLLKVRPRSIGQASRISGVSPADVSVLIVWSSQNGKE